MYQWQNLLNDGNDCFHNKNWGQAEYCYKEAAFHLDSLWAADSRNVQLLMAWICVSHNLATLFEVQDNPDLSLQYLLIPHNRMLTICNSADSCEDTRLIAQNALKVTFMPILMFSKRHPMCNTCQKSLADFKASLESNQQVIH
ncbi:hypothetical protein A9Q74_07680 [Colwellia sp. 39_35_sub15_T18]|nr:hypothetical protein A9Q74_07680 [Colwellia sp. 39_35_sub15_T18]